MEEREAESIEIIREVAATARNPAILDAGDERSAAMLQLATLAFRPAALPFPVVRADAAIGAQRFDVIIDAAGQAYEHGDASGRAPSSFPVCNMRVAAGRTVRVLPFSSWSSADVRKYLERESIAVDPEAAAPKPRADRGALAALSSLPVLACGGASEGTRALMPRGGEETPADAPFVMPVQLVLHAGAVRGFAGRVASGRIRVGDTLRILPSGAATRVKAILRGRHAPTACEAGESVTLTLMDDVDASRGDVLASAEEPPQAADQFEARLLWMDEHPMVPGRSYFLKIHARETSAQVTAIKYREEAASGAHLAARQLERGEVGVVNLSTSQPVVFEPCAKSRTLGTFILVDKAGLRTVGAGTIDFALRRAANLHWQALDVDKHARAQSMHQHPRCIWFTGLSGSGKSTLANLLEKRLHAQGRHTYVLDGDNVRHGLNRDLGFTEADRVENIRRVAEVAKLMVDAGLIVIVSFISPFRAERRTARALFAPGEFFEVFVDTPLEECERRDPKGLYAKARRGELANMTGIDSPYEAPESPELRVDTVGAPPEDLVRRIIERL